MKALIIYGCCRGAVTANAMGWLELGPMDEGGSGGGHAQVTVNMNDVYPGSEPS